MKGTGSEVKKIFTGLAKKYKPGSIKKPLSFYFSLDDEKWTVFLTPEKCQVQGGKATDAADCVLKTSPELFVKIWRGEYTPGAMDFMSGKVRSNAPQLLRDFENAFEK
jgi:putative sterol carrier protein